MAQHKWHKEIKAWADGAEIEKWMLNDTWQIELRPGWYDYEQYRIKQQPKEPQYLYAYQNVDGKCVISIFSDKYNGQKPIGKIKLEVNND